MVLELLLGRRALGELSCDENEAEPECPPEKEDRSENSRRGPRIIYFDLETQRSAQEVGGWRNCHLMKISVAGVYDTLEERFRIFREDQVDELLALLEKADLIVGFNIKRFDYDVLKGYTAKDLKELPTFDILEDIHQRLGYRLSLDHLAVETLHRSKSGDGLQALEWFKAGEMEKLSEYCLLDVEITKAIFEYGLENGHIVYRTKQEDQRVLLRVDWNLANLIPK